MTAPLCDWCGEDATDCGGQVCPSCSEPMLCSERCQGDECGCTWLDRQHPECCEYERENAPGVQQQEDEREYHALRSREMQAERRGRA